MSLDIEWHPDARAELEADVDWHEDRQAGLGERFEHEVVTCVEESARTPASWPVWPGWTSEPVVHSKSVARFPYRVVDYVTGHRYLVVAVAHERRRPGYWRERVADPG